MFVSSVEHAHALAAMIPGAVAVDGKTPLDERRRLVDAFTNREIAVLVNYGVFTEGTDLPLIETVLLARPTANVSLYTQMVGRGLRLSPGKKALRLIDCVGVSEDKRLCTVSSLFGIKDSDVPEYAKDVLDGPASTLEKRLAEAWDCPKGWVLSARRVDVIGNAFKISWKRMSNGDLLCSLPRGAYVAISAPDALGRYRIASSDPDMLRRADPKGYAGVADADAVVFAVLNGALYGRYRGSRNIWAADRAERWENDPATAGQMSYIKGLIGEEEAAALGEITKAEAGAVIDSAKAKQERGLGTCPQCGAPLKRSRTGKTAQCSTNKWVKGGAGDWKLVAGCGYQERLESPAV